MNTEKKPTNNTSRSILLVTRPLSPPWDEASKNFAFDLACNAKHHRITILVDELMDNIPEHIQQKKIYSANRFSLWQKTRLIIFLAYNASNYDGVHLLFTPTKFNSAILRMILRYTHVIQTIATVRDDLYNKNELVKMYFGKTLVTYSLWAQKKLTTLQLKNVHQIYPGINMSKYVPSQKNMSLLQQWNIKSEKIIVTYPGEFSRLGATDLIIDALIEIWNSTPESEIHYICACRVKNRFDVQKKEAVIKKLTDAGHLDKVTFTDTFRDMNAIYNLSDIILFPVTDMFGKFDVPLAMIEPYACKKAVIASHLPLFEEFSDPQINVIIPTADKHALIQEIIALAKDMQKRRLLGENAYAFAHRTFNITSIAQQYENLYKQIPQQNRENQ